MTFYIWLLACTYKTNSPSIASSDNQPQDTNSQSDDTSIVDSGDSTDTASIDTADTSDTTDTTDTSDSGSNVVMVTDFTLPDVNPQSATFGQDYSPRDYLQKVSGWYFIKGT